VAKKATTPLGAVEFGEKTATVAIRRGSEIIVTALRYRVKC
jgi:hypothetical protein